MPIILKYNYEPGWNKNAVKHATDDPILVVTFIDEATKRTLFKYGASFKDIRFWIEYFAELGRHETEKIRKNTQMETCAGNVRKTQSNAKETCENKAAIPVA